MKKTAIFGGTFNPPHIGHRFMLEGIASQPEIEKILIMPAKAPPHKSGVVVSAEHRVNMCKMAFCGIEKCEISLEELNLPGKSYTVNTLHHLNKKGIKNPVLVIGADSLVNFNKWYRYDEILSLAELYVYKRKGIDVAVLLSAKKELEKQGAKITILDICPPAVSSTDIRVAFGKAENLKSLLEPNVLKYINEHSLY